MRRRLRGPSVFNLTKSQKIFHTIYKVLYFLCSAWARRSNHYTLFVFGKMLTVIVIKKNVCTPAIRLFACYSEFQRSLIANWCATWNLPDDGIPMPDVYRLVFSPVHLHEMPSFHGMGRCRNILKNKKMRIKNRSFNINNAKALHKINVFFCGTHQKKPTRTTLYTKEV